MTKQKELNILAIAPSRSEADRFVVVLVEHQGTRRIPVLMGQCEAQAIAMGIEGIETEPPQTHELGLALLEQGGLTLLEVRIDTYRDGQFGAQLVLRSEQGEQTLAARVSDALALAVRTPCPIFAPEAVLAQAGVTPPLTTKEIEDMPRLYQTETPEELEQLLEEALQQEDYERAARIRQALQRAQE